MNEYEEDNANEGNIEKIPSHVSTAISTNCSNNQSNSNALEHGVKNIKKAIDDIVNACLNGKCPPDKFNEVFDRIGKLVEEKKHY